MSWGGWLNAEARAQYGAMIAMRWRMFINGLHTIYGILDLGATGVAWVFYGVIGLGAGTGLAAGSYAMAQHGRWNHLPILFWVTSLIWLMLPAIAASYQDQTNLGTLLRFPLRLSSYFTLYLISGLMDASTIVGSLCCCGIWLGVFLSPAKVAGPLAGVLALFAVFNVLLVRAVFAWIDRWLAQRKSREILGAVFLLLVVGAQVLNPALYRHGRNPAGETAQQRQAEARELRERYMPALRIAYAAQQWLPQGSASNAVAESAEGHGAAAVLWLGLLGLWMVAAGGVLGLRLRAEYRGENLGWAPARSAETGPERTWTLGGSGAWSAVVEKEVRSLKRTLPYLFALGAPLLLMLVIAGLFHPGSSGQEAPYALPLCVAYALLGFTPLFYNSLGAEGGGIQLLILSPTPIRTVMLGKNLLYGVLYLSVAGAAVGLGCFRLGVPPAPLLAALGAWVIFALPCGWIAGNILSLTMPYRVNPGRIGQAPGSQANRFTSMAIQAATLGVGAAVFAVCRSLGKPWWAVFILLLLAVGAYFVWRRVLSNMEAMLLDRREELIECLMKVL